MARPIVIGHRLIWTAYGWWLPTDPRGSSSQTIRRDVIAELGSLHQGRKKVQPASAVVRDFYEQAAGKLMFPLLEISPAGFDAIAESFADAITEHRYTCYACAIMPDHIHMLIRKHKYQAEQMIAHFQEASRLRLRALRLRDHDHPTWGGPGWKVFLDHPDEIRRTIRYVEDNPMKMGLPTQTWPFVKEYDGWPLHEGHSANSPYVRRMGKK